MLKWILWWVIISYVDSLVSVDDFNSKCNNQLNVQLKSRITSIVLNNDVYVIDGVSPLSNESCPSNTQIFKWNLNETPPISKFSNIKSWPSLISAGAGFSSDGLICLIATWSPLVCYDPKSNTSINISSSNEFDIKIPIFGHTVSYNSQTRIGILLGGAFDNNQLVYLKDSYRFNFIPHDISQPLSSTNQPKITFYKLSSPLFAEFGLIGHTATLVDKTLYVIGGSRINAQNSDIAVVAMLPDITQSNEWLYLNKPNKNGFRDHVAFYKENHIIVIGGRDLTGPKSILNQVLSFNIKDRIWLVLPNLDSIYRTEAALIQKSDFVALAGGITTVNKKESLAMDIQILDLSNFPSKISKGPGLNLGYLSNNFLYQNPKKDNSQELQERLDKIDKVPLIPILLSCLGVAILAIIGAGIGIWLKIRRNRAAAWEDNGLSLDSKETLDSKSNFYNYANPTHFRARDHTGDCFNNLPVTDESSTNCHPEASADPAPPL